MTTVNVYYGADTPTHDVSLSDGTLTYGFQLIGGPRAFQEIPLTPPAQDFEIKQTAFVGGRGRLNIADDATGFYDSQNLWSTTEGYICPSLLWQYRPRTQVEEYLPTRTSNYLWSVLYGQTRYRAVAFVATSTDTRDKAYMFIKKIGTPGTLTFELCSNSAGEPGAVLQTVTKANISDLVSLYNVFDWSGTQAVVSGTTYHLKLYGASTDDANNYWSVLSDSEMGGSTMYSSVGTAGNWATSSTEKLYFRILSADSLRRFYYFNLYGAWYAVAKNDSRAASAILMNGFRGIASAGTTTTLTCAQTCARDYSGAYIKILDGTGDGQIRQITSNTQGASVVFTVPTWDVTPDATSIFVVYGTLFWDAVTGTSGLGYVTGKPAISNNIAYFPQGQGVAVRRMRVNGNSHDFAAEATALADIVYCDSGKVYLANAAASTIYKPPVVAWGTDLVPGTAVPVGESVYRITNMYNYKGTFIIFKEDGPYSYDGTTVVRMGRNFSDNPDANNGLGATDDGTYLWWTWGHSVERMLGTNVTDLLNWRSGYEGMPADRRGAVVEILSVIGWTFFVVDGGASNFSSIIVWNGFGWHEVFRGFSAGIRIRDICWIPCPETRPQLWFSVNGALMCIEFPINASDPQKDSTLGYSPEGVMITPTLNNGTIETYKIFKSIKVFQKSSTAQSTPFEQKSVTEIHVDYQFNANVGTSDWTNLGTADIAPFEALVYNTGNITQMRLRFRLQSDSANDPAVMYSWNVTGREAEASKYRFIGSFMAGTSLETKTNDEEISSDTVYTWLVDAAVKQKKLTLRTIFASSDNKLVTVSLPVKVIDGVDEETPGAWSGSIQFAANEI